MILMSVVPLQGVSYGRVEFRELARSSAWGLLCASRFTSAGVALLRVTPSRVDRGRSRVFTEWLQGYLAHKKTPTPRGTP